MIGNAVAGGRDGATAASRAWWCHAAGRPQTLPGALASCWRPAVLPRAGLELDSTGKVRETVLDLPVAGLPGPNEPLFGPGYFDDHALSRAGVAVDERRGGPVDGEARPVYENLHAAGRPSPGAVPWREGSGNGLSLASGYAAASAILEERISVPPGNTCRFWPAITRAR